MGTKKLVRFSIYHKILLTMLFVSLLPLAGLWYINYQQSYVRTEVELKKNLSQTGQILAGKINSWIDINVRSSNQIARTEDIKSMEPTRQYPLLKATDDTYEWSYTAFTTDIKGMAITRSDGKPLKYYGDREYVKQVLDGGKTGQQVLISRVNGKPALCLSVPVYKPNPAVNELDFVLYHEANDGTNINGVLVQCSKLVEIANAVSVVKIGKTGVAFLVDRKSRLIAHGDQTKLTKQLANFDKNKAIRSTLDKFGIVTFAEDGVKKVAHTHKLNLDWTLVIQQDYDEAFAELIQAKENAYILLAGIILVVALVALAFSRRLSNPIRILTMQAEKISKGDLSATVTEDKRSDEIGELARALDRLKASFLIARKMASPSSKSKVSMDKEPAYSPH